MIRKYKAEDTEEILDIWHEASKTAHPFLNSEFIKHEKENIREIYLPKAETWVYEENKSMLGFISMLGNEVAGIFVKPEKHRKGIGRKLLNYVSKFKKELEVEVFKANKMAILFYENYGFKVTKELVHQETGHKLLRMKCLKKT